MGNTNFSSFYENMAFWSLKDQNSGINIYLISKLWLFGIHFYHKPQCLLLKKYLPENLKYLIFYVTSSKIPYTFLSFGLLSECFISTLNLFYPQNLMFLILSNEIYWINKILHIFSVFLPSYLLPKRQKN